MWASFNGHTKTAQLLIEKCADVDAKSNYGSTPLMAASYKGHTETATATHRKRCRSRC